MTDPSSSSAAAFERQLDDDVTRNIAQQQQHRQRCKRRSNIPVLVCAFMASLTTGGTTYAFGLYGVTLKRNLHLSERELDTISTWFFVAGLFSWIPGWIADRFGTRFALSAGGITGAACLVTYWGVAREFLVLPARAYLVPSLSLLGVLIFLSSALVTGSVFKIIVASCGPGSKGSAVGVAKGYVGLGSGVYACLFQSIKHRDTSDLDFLPMAAFFAICCATLPALIFLPQKQQAQAQSSSSQQRQQQQSSLQERRQREPSSSLPQEINYKDDSTKWHFRTLMVSLAIMGMFIVGNSLMELEEHVSYHASSRDRQQVTNADDNDERHAFRRLFLRRLASSSSGSAAGPHYGTAVMLLLVWLGPIASLMFLPRREAQGGGGSRDDYAHTVLATEDHDDDDFERDEPEEQSQGGAIGGGCCSSSSVHSADKTQATSISTTSEQQEDHGAVEMMVQNEDHDVNHSGHHRDHDDDDDAVSAEEQEGEHLLQQTSNSHQDSSFSSRDAPPAAFETAGAGHVQLRDGAAASAGAQARTSTGAGVEEGPDSNNLNLVQMLKTPSAQLMLWTAIVLVGAGTVETNNMGQMVESLSFDGTVTTSSLALFSVAQAAGRVATGAVSEAALSWNTTPCFRRALCTSRRAGVPRPFFLAVASLAGFAAHLILAAASEEFAFVAGVALSGFAFGMVWPLMVLIVGEVFGTANVGANYMFYDGTTSAFGTLFLTKVLAQDVYEDHIPPDAEDETTCMGKACFAATHAIIAALSLSCVATSMIMVYTSRHVYNGTATSQHA